MVLFVSFENITRFYGAKDRILASRIIVISHSVRRRDTTTSLTTDDLKIALTTKIDATQIGDSFSLNKAEFGSDDKHKRSATTSEIDEEIAIEITSAKGPIIDFISVGTLSRSELQDAQERTFGSHPSVRNFFRMTELNDTDATCYTNLTVRQRESVVDFCQNENHQSYVSAILRKQLRPFQSYKHSTGWMCAQKRPIDGLRLVLEKYKNEALPSYLIIVDDDSYFNMNAIVNTLQHSYSEDELHVLSGFIFNFPKELHFTFPYGGFGSILTRKAIGNLIRPIRCDASEPDGFTRMACWRLSQNHVGEQQHFREGMSVADLMYAYSMELRFADVDRWNWHGFCFHSDHALGYFIAYYHVAVPDDRLERAEINDKLRQNNDFGFVHLSDGVVQSLNEREKCSPQSLICHYAEPNQMDRLFAIEIASPPQKVAPIKVSMHMSARLLSLLRDFSSHAYRVQASAVLATIRRRSSSFN